MLYRTDQLQVSGKSGCVAATVLHRDMFNDGGGTLALKIGNEVAILTHEQANVLAAYLTTFDGNTRVA